MANGLDELIDGLVADVAYAGETGLSVTSFIATVTSKLREPQKRKASIWTEREGDEEAQNAGADSAAQEKPLVETAGVQLARKAWTWLANRPEILVGRDGSQKHLSLDDALALPEPQPPAPGPTDESDGVQKAAAPTGATSKTAPLGSAKSKAKRSSANGAAATAADPTVRPRLYANERTIWNTVTGHDVDYKKVPPLEWKCLMGIASARDRGILQADLRALVNQDKRSVPKRTDFLAAKGYIVKRAILTRGNRTSILWLTEFAPVELHDGDDGKTASNATPATDSSFSFSKDLASAGGSSTAVDFSPAFLTKDLEPVPWRSRWLGNSIEFASFGQTILAIVKAWAVIRVIDLKQKLGILGLRWQMRTLSRLCREFVACGVLRFVAAVRRDEHRLFKDCLKFEREPTNSEWAMILASGRRRAPLTELLATQKKQRQQKEARALGQTAPEDDQLLDDDLDDEGDEGGVGLAAATTVVPTWVPEVPLVNQIFDFVQRAGSDGTTAPAVTRTTLGPSFARYVFALLTDLAKPRTQPSHLAHFQLVSEPTRVGRNNAYMFKAAGSSGPVDSPFPATGPSDLSSVTASQASQAFGFSTPTGHLAQQTLVQSLSDSAHSAVIQHPAFLRRQRRWVPPSRGRGRPRRNARLQDEEEKEGTDKEASDGEKHHDGEAAVGGTANREAEPPAASTDPPRRKRGRPPKKKVAQSTPEPLPLQAGSDQGGAVDGLSLEDTSTAPRPLVTRGSLSKAKTMGRPRKSLVLDFCIPKLRDRQFLASGSGYKDGVPTPGSRTDTSESEGDEEGRKEREEEANTDGEALENRPNSKPPSDPRLHAVAAIYQGSPGRLTLDHEAEKLRFIFDTGSESGREPMAIPAGNIVNEPSMRDVPGGGGQAFVFEARAWEEGNQQPPTATWPFVFVLAHEPPDNSAHAATLLDAVVNLLRDINTTAEAAVPGEGQEETEEETGTPLSSAPATSQSTRVPGRRGSRKGKKKDSKNSGPQEFVCETCEGRWKNLVGLRYHQRKSQTSCNPSYVPPPLPALQQNPRIWKNDKKAETSTPTTPSTSSKGVSQQLPDLARRLFVSNAGDSRPSSRPLSRHRGIQNPTPTAPQTVNEETVGGLSQKRVAGDLEGEDGPDDTKRQKRDDTETSNVAEEQEGVRTPPALRTILLSSAAPTMPRSTPNDTPCRIVSPGNTAMRPRAPTPRTTTSAPGFRMPAGTPNSLSSKSKATKSMLRSQRTTEIIKYLLDRYDGVFPSDKSLWYAVFGVYTRTFPSEEPPTFNVCKTAVKKLDTSRELEEHTFGFRDAKGLFNYCRLIARPGVDLLLSESAKDFKMRLQQSFPQPYVPAEYAPTDKDLAVLRLWDRDGTVDDVKKARAKRGRRSLAPEIEVLNAPFYGKPNFQRQSLRAGATGPLLIDYGQSEGSDDGEGDKEQRQQAVESRNNPSGSRNGGHETANNAKRRKVTRFADFIAGNDETEASEDGAEDRDGGAYGGLLDIDEAAAHDGVFDNEDNIDPALRTRRAPRNPGLGSLPATFFPPGSRHEEPKRMQVQRQPRGHQQQAVSDCSLTFIFVQPGRVLKDGTGRTGDYVKDDNDDSDDDGVDSDSGIDEGVLHSSSTVPHERGADWPSPTEHTFVSKLVVLQDAGSAPGVWPVLSQTYFQQEAPASFTMDGYMPSRKALLRENLPRSVDDCVEMLRANQKLPSVDATPAGRFYFDVNCCRFWELSQKGTQILCHNASVAPEYVFLNLSFPGAHYTVERAQAEMAEAEKAKTNVLPSPALWDAGNQFTVESLPYRTLEDTDDTAGSVSQSELSQQGSGARGRGRGDHRGDSRTGPPKPAKYVLRSRREMTAYPQKPEDYIRKETAEETSNVVVVDSANNSGEDVDWKAEDTRIAAFVAIKTLVGGLSQAMDWGLLMRLFPDWKLSALRLFWTSIRKQRPAYIDQLTQRFQQSFLEAYTNRELPALDFDRVVEYDWPRLISWTVRLMRRDAVHAVLPATRERLTQAYDCVEQPPRMVGWREEYFHSARSMWNRLQDSASEAAALSLDAGPPATPAEAMAASAGAADSSKFSDMARHMVARSWIRALCATPHDRYPPSRIKQKLLTLGAGLGGKKGGHGDEAAVNRLLQTVIAELQNERVLRRSKSVVALGGRMYVLAEAYGNTLEKVAQQDKFRQAWAFKAKLDACFRAGPRPAYEIPLTMNDDGMVMALINLQAHGRVAVQAIDAPHVPFGFEPGNYETRKFPKHYQRFRQRIVPTARYVFNEDAELKTLVQRAREAAEAEMRTEAAEDVAASASSSGPPREMPVWRDFFGVLDRGRFAKLASAVVFSQATRGATPVKQTAAHLRPVLEPFEVQILMDWATSAGILTESELPGGGGGPTCPAEDPVGRTVSEWWWLLTGQVYMELWAEEAKEKERAKEREKWQSIVISDGATRGSGDDAVDVAIDADEDGSEDGHGDDTMAGALP